MSWVATGPGQWSFETRLPRRFDAQGCTRAGAWVNGGWYPQPTLDGDVLPAVAWTATVRAERGVVVAGEGVGLGIAQWTGTAERVAVAVLPRGQVQAIGAEGWSLTLVEQGARRKVLSREISRIGGAVGPRPAVVVEGPLRRRLARPGPGVLYVSDRAFRLTPGLAGAHRLGVARGFLAAGLRGSDAWLRELGASAALPEIARGVRAFDTVSTLKRFAWIPEIDHLLSSRRLPFYADVLGDAVSGDPLADDLAERLRPSFPPSQVAAQVLDRFGDGPRRAVAALVAAGAAADTVEAEAGLPPGWLATWRQAPTPEDYELTVVTGSEPRVEVVREASPSAPDETVIVRIDGVDLARTGPPGQFVFRLPADPRHVSIDPLHHLAQTSQLGDVWPPRYTTTFAAGIDAVNLTRGSLTASASGTLRRTGDTHNVFNAGVGHTEVNLVSLRVGWSRREGPLLDGFSRPHRFSVSVAASLLDSEFSATPASPVAIDLGVGYSTDDRVSWEFPLRGKRFFANGGGGGIPATGETWTSAGAGTLGIVSPHPRHAFAARITGSLARSDVAHRLLSLGGAGAMASIPQLPACGSAAAVGEPCQVVATRRALTALEYRLAVIRGASIPAVLAWGSELQLAFGLEGVLAQAEGPVSAAGATLGVTGIYDLFGAQPSMIGITAGWPLAWSGIALEPTAVPELYLRWSQAF